MGRTLDRCQLIERSILTTYRETIWTPFMKAIRRYELIQPGDKIAVCISGGKDSMLLAKLFQQLQRHTEIPFEVVYLVMDPGYNPENRQKIESNAALLRIPAVIFETNIFEIANEQDKNACFLCARMRRGHLYSKAQSLGCNKIALGHHFNDVIETPLISMFYGAQLQAMRPRVKATNFPGMELIRPLYMVGEDAIIAWKNYNHLDFIQCACRFTENRDRGLQDSKRQEAKELIRRMKKTNRDIDMNIFNSIHSVQLDTMPGWKKDGEYHSFLEEFADPDAGE